MRGRRGSDPDGGRSLGIGTFGLWAGGIWLLGSLLPKTRSRVVVHSIPDWDDNALALLAEVLDRGHRATVLLESVDSRCPDDALASRVETLPKNSWRGRLAYLTTRLVITTHGVYRPHRVPRGMRLLNVWHGERLGKKVGRWDGHPGTPCTWSVALSVVGQAFRCAQMDLPPSRVLVVGSPRNDRMLRADPDRIRQAVCRPQASQTWLWLPTYRMSAVTGRIDGDAERRGSLGFTAAEIADLEDWLVSRDIDILVKPHPLSAATDWPQGSRLRLLATTDMQQARITLGDLLATVDGLITDASAVWVDYLLMRRPIVFAFPDIDSYRERRGLLLEPYESWVPGPLVTTGPALLAALSDLVSGRDAFAAAREEWRRRAHLHTDDGSTARLLDAVGLDQRARMVRPARQTDVHVEGASTRNANG